MPPVTSKNLNQPTQETSTNRGTNPQKRTPCGPPPDIPETPVFFVGFLRSEKKTLRNDGCGTERIDRNGGFLYLALVEGSCDIDVGVLAREPQRVVFGGFGMWCIYLACDFLGQPPQKTRVWLKMGD